MMDGLLYIRDISFYYEGGLNKTIVNFPVVSKQYCEQYAVTPFSLPVLSTDSFISSADN